MRKGNGMKTFEEELDETIASFVMSIIEGMGDWDGLRSQIIAAHQAEMDRVVDEVIDAAKLTGDSRGEENIGIILSTISVITRKQRARYKAMKEQK
jgi:hypothetical protein